MILCMLISKNDKLKDLLEALFNSYDRVEISYYQTIEEAMPHWLEIHPAITVLDSDLSYNSALKFTSDISEKYEILHSANQFIFISHSDSESIDNVKKALEKTRFGSFTVKGIHDDKNIEYQEILLHIKHVYDFFVGEQKKKYINNQKIENDIMGNSDNSTLNKFKVIIDKITKNPIDIIVIGVSTGGPQVLKKLFERIKHVKYPIVVVQHMIPNFIESYIQTLSSSITLPISIAKQGVSLKAGQIYFAPDNAHLRINNIDGVLSILLDHSKPIKSYLPSIEVTFESIMKENISCLGVILTGIGDDGTTNLKLLHDKGMPTIAQSPEDAITFGMPQSLINKNAADAILNIQHIATVFESI